MKHWHRLDMNILLTQHPPERLERPDMWMDDKHQVNGPGVGKGDQGSCTL